MRMQSHLGLLRIDSIFWKGIENVLHLEEHARQAFASGSSIGRPAHFVEASDPFVCLASINGAGSHVQDLETNR
jgi:hypothetical protein